MLLMYFGAVGVKLGTRTFECEADGSTEPYDLDTSDSVVFDVEGGI